MSFYDTELTPEICMHNDLDEVDEDAVCHECMAIIYKQEFPVKKEIIDFSTAPKEDDLRDIEVKY
jgi:hypothetical protein